VLRRRLVLKESHRLDVRVSLTATKGSERKQEDERKGFKKVFQGDGFQKVEGGKEKNRTRFKNSNEPGREKEKEAPSAEKEKPTLEGSSKVLGGKNNRGGGKRQRVKAGGKV